MTGGDSNARVEYLQFRGRWLGLDWELMEGGRKEKEENSEHKVSG